MLSSKLEQLDAEMLSGCGVVPEKEVVGPLTGVCAASITK